MKVGGLSVDPAILEARFAAGWSYADLIARIVDAAFTSQGPLSRARGGRRAEVPA